MKIKVLVNFSFVIILVKTVSPLHTQVCPQTGLDESTDWKNVTLDTSFSFGTLRTTTSAMIEEMKMKLEKLTSIGEFISL